MAGERFTVFGGGGFIGSRLVKTLTTTGHTVVTIDRSSWPENGADLGHVIFTIGMTAQFRGLPFETVETQIFRLYDALNRYRYSSFLYLSSTRLYQGAVTTSEDTNISACPNDPDAIYNLTKATAECLCQSINNPAVRVVRLSNVYGPELDSNLFLADVMREAALTGRVTFRSHPLSAKDYVHVSNVADLLPSIALKGTKRTYNVGFGRNVNNAEIGAALAKLGIMINYLPDAPELSFPEIDISRLTAEFPQPTFELLPTIPALLEAKRKIVQQ